MNKEKLLKNRNKLISLVLMLVICEFIQLIVFLSNEYTVNPILSAIETIIIFFTVVYTVVVVSNIIIYINENIEKNNKAE